uniref:polyubiquitin-like n=1 Tax=Styela clava TaxID=7725 RepID=UPI00193A57ED|nr:polyubiquitin-like [Styela clava]
MHERRQIPLDVEHSELVQNLKKKIQEREGFSVDQQVLMFNGREINGRLNHSEVGDGSTLHLYFKKVQIFVRDFEGRSHTFEVHLTDKVQDFKKQVERKIGVTASQQRLEYAGRQLMDGQRLLDMAFNKIQHWS